jgi:hypothetical protein
LALRQLRCLRRFTCVGHITQPSPPTAFTLAVTENASRHSSLSSDRRYVVSTAFDPAVTSYADVDRLLRTEAQVHLTPFVLNNHPTSFKSHTCLLSATPAIAEQQQQKPFLRGSAHSRPQGVSPVFRTALRSVCADQGAFHSRCASLQALGDSPPLAVATPAGVGLGQGVVV